MGPTIELTDEEYEALRTELEDRLTDLLDSLEDDVHYLPSVIRVKRILEKNFGFRLTGEELTRYKNILEDIVKRNGLDIEYKTLEELEDGLLRWLK